MESITSINLPIKLVAQAIFYIILIAYVIFTIIFYYHWQNYSVEKKATVQTYLAFFIITLPLLAIMGFAVLII